MVTESGIDFLKSSNVHVVKDILQSKVREVYLCIIQQIIQVFNDWNTQEMKNTQNWSGDLCEYSQNRGLTGGKGHKQIEVVISDCSK